MTEKPVKALGWLIVAGGTLFLTTHSAAAQESVVRGSPLGLYVGGGVGLSTIRQDSNAETLDLSLSREEVGWDAFLGVRPTRYVGAEIGYLDFGTARQHQHGPPSLAPGEVWQLHESAHAPVAFAVGYIPLQPWWDLYVKLGAARLHKSWYAETPAACTEVPGECSGTYVFPGDESNWDFAYGVGTQVSYGALAWRLEYVRVNTSGNAAVGDPDLLNVGVSWTFF